MALINSFKDQLLNKLLRNVDFSAPASVFVSLHSEDPGTTGANEIAAVGRKQITFTASANGMVANTATVEFTGMPAVNVSHVGLWTASNGGTFVWGGSVSAPKIFGLGDSCQIKAAALTATLV